MPATAASAKVVGFGIRSPIARATPTMAAAPSRSTMIATVRTGPRLPAHPPLKSPAPQATADASPRTTTARPGPAGSAVDRSGRRALGHGSFRLVAGPVVDVRRPGQGDDRVGGGVVPVGRGQVDHLEVPRDLPQQVDG